MADQPFVQVRSSTVVYENPWMRVREDDLVRADGGSGIYGVVEKPDFAVVVPEQYGRFHLVEQYRFAIGRRSWEFPQGGWPPGRVLPPGSSEDLARTELAEETGFTATSWRRLGHLKASLGFCNQGFDVFHATELQAGPHAREATEADMVQGDFSEADLVAMIAAGQIVDDCTVAAYALLRLIRPGVAAS